MGVPHRVDVLPVSIRVLGRNGIDVRRVVYYDLGLALNTARAAHPLPAVSTSGSPF
jgi:hypothetical protein